MSNAPLVTVYIPTYNRHALLERAVNSVLSQTYGNIELIIVDDCSCDGTIKYLQKLVQLDKRVRYLVNSYNSGACASRNKAIMVAKGEFITGLDDDDYFLPGRIDKFVTQWPLLKAKYPDMILLFSNFLVKHDEADYGKLKQYMKPKNVKQNDLLIANFIGNQVFTKTESLRQVMFDENLPMWQDLDCWYRLLGKGYALNINLAEYVLDVSHPHERISSNNNNNLELVLDKFISKYELNESEAAILEGHVYAYELRELKFHTFLNLSKRQKNILANYYLFKKFIKNNYVKKFK